MRGKQFLVLGQVLFIIMLVALYLYKPITAADFSSIDAFVRYARSFGMIMPVAVFLITLTQAILPGIPFVILCSANGLFFGLWGGSLFTLTASLLGAATLFYFSRVMGYEWTDRVHERYKLGQARDLMSGNKGFMAVLVMRLIPVVPSTLINVGAGISKISFGSFILASTLGKIPFVVGYTWLGYNLLYAKNLVIPIICIGVLLVIAYMGLKVSRRF